MKTCNQCKEKKALDQFCKMHTSPDGHGYVCRPCEKIRNRAAYQARKEEIKARVKTYAAANKEKVAAGHHARYLANKENRAAKSKLYRETHKDELKLKNRQKYLANKAKWAEYGRKRRSTKQDEVLAYRKAYTQTERGKLLVGEAQKRTRQRHPDHFKARRSVGSAIRNGTLVRPNSCQSCNNPCKPEGHHYLGYAKENWLDVRWLCKPCHKIEDGLQGVSWGCQ